MNAHLPVPAEFAEIATICAAKDGIIGGRSCLTVDARDLHAGLGVGRDLSTWIEGRIKKFGFREGVDFEVSLKSEKNLDEALSPQTGEKSKMGRPMQDRRLTLDMAKELSMVENNEQGRLARRYFIWREQQALALQPSVSVAEIERRMMSALGGMVKGIVLKQVGTRMDAVEARLETALASYDPSAAFVTDHHPILYVIEEYKVPQKGRRGLSTQCSKRCERWLQSKGMGGMIRISRETGRKMFKEAGLKAWLAAEGANILIAARDRAIGQSTIPFPKGGRR